ncbi:NAD(P)H-hydrate dehydratase [Alisedimentitalea sp. MJ-SS2]|uniref:NAD(P)H-hydrate dehydratase n=1 Tax=Aliisedimentitalea sp. MJ-SS2 TaxID=3049795 RepID=UPI00290E185A|nr:NAD(P)H-hydrate dehydratase [Alisedimentitalea sp. MJ-SS2]MDU8926504.1 NAD(P)H-hydrate dehydratase [Alisedimentitalea sp. MJ-SS2]
MTELLTAAQMRAIEMAAIESGEVTGLELMERAGQGVVEAVFEEWPELAKTSHRAVVLCGPGNNGGDGFVVARLLKEWGWEVEVFLYGDASRLPRDARVNCERWLEMGEVRPIREMLDAAEIMDVFIDAGFGTGLTRRLPIEFEKVFSTQLSQLAKRLFSRSVSVDMPSGVCSDSGKAINDLSLMTDLLVTFHRAKCGTYLGMPYSPKKICAVDIGLEPFAVDPETSEEEGAFFAAELVSPKLGTVSDYPVKLLTRENAESPEDLPKFYADHKFDYGHALILSGSCGKTGAARLAARGALRIGAGLVTLGVPGSAQMEVASHVTSIMLRRAGTPDELTGVLQDGRLNAVCIGPGLGVDRARALVEVTVRAGHTPYVVLDADALTAFEGEPEVLFSLLHEGCVLTPHGGEFRRLFPDIAEKLAAPATKGPAYSKVDATREAAARAGCVVLYKGPDTVIASPDGQCSINSAHYERAVPWLATAGSGDVLAGFITGLLARGFSPMQAAETAAWLHVECALSFGPGLIAEDIPEELPKVFRALGV